MFNFMKKNTSTRKHTGLAFCETVYATGTSPVHIRALTEEGLFLSGGADSKSFCLLKVSWDTSEVKSLESLNARIANSHESNRTCVECVETATKLLLTKEK